MLLIKLCVDYYVFYLSLKIWICHQTPCTIKSIMLHTLTPFQMIPFTPPVAFDRNNREMTARIITNSRATSCKNTRYNCSHFNPCPTHPRARTPRSSRYRASWQLVQTLVSRNLPGSKLIYHRLLFALKSLGFPELVGNPSRSLPFKWSPVGQFYCRGGRKTLATGFPI